MSEADGQTIDRYRVSARLSEDRWAATFRAFDPKFDREVVIYLINEADHQGDYFLQEARTIVGWRHSGLARLFDFGEYQGKVFAVQESLPGFNLRQVLIEMRRANCWLSLQEGALLIKELCLALDFVHQRGLLYGALEPACLQFRLEPTESLPYQPVIARAGLVKPGTGLAPAAYRPPETAHGGRFQKSSDIYALGAILYELATGQPPTPQSQVSSGPAQVLAPHVLHPDLPEWLEKVILKALSPNPLDRFEDASQMASALGEVQNIAARGIGAPSGFSRLSQLKPFLEQSLTPAEPGVSGTAQSKIPEVIPPVPAVDISDDTLYVLMPDKSVRSFKMKPNGMVIGRNREADIPLDLPGVSRQHARIDFDGQNYQIRDLRSLNGTFIEGKRISPEISQIWNPGENLRIGEAWFRIERKNQTRTTQAVVSRELPTKPGASLPETDEVFVGISGSLIEASQVFRSGGLGWVGVFTESLNVSVAPGSSIEIPLLLFNRGPANDTFKISLQGIPAEWTPKIPQSVRVPSNGQSEASLVIHPPRTTLVKAGRYPVVVRVISQNTANQMVDLRLTLTVTAFSLFSSELQPETVRPGETGQVMIHNRGNLPETFTVIWEDRTHALVFDPPQVKVNLQVGKSAVVEYRPSLLHQRMVGPEESYPFRVHISSQAGQVETHQAEYLSKGVVPSWAPVALGGLIVILACVICLLVNQFTFPVRTAERTANASRTIAALVSQAGSAQLTATSIALEGGSLATAQAATATAAWLVVDGDNDGLTADEELKAGTLPNVADTDGDGLSDGDEVHKYKTDPLHKDTDRDGLFDGEEITMGTDPLKQDTDGDGVNDMEDADPLRWSTSTPSFRPPTFQPPTNPPPFFTFTPRATKTKTPTLTPTATQAPRAADLRIQVTNGQAYSIPGTNTSYTIVVINQGPSAVVGAQIIDQFPAALSNITWTCTESPGSRCQTPIGAGNISALVDLAVGGTASFVASTNIAPNVTGQLENTVRALVPAGITELNPGDNTAVDGDTLTPRAALSLTKTDNKDSVLAGAATAYTISIVNNGPSSVSGIQLKDSLPDKLEGISWTCTATTGSSCSQPGPQPGNIDTQVSLNPGGTASFKVNASVKSGASGTLSNSATITSPVDPATNNKTATDTTQIVPQADLRVDITSLPATVGTSSPLTYTITVTNSGPSPATGILLTDTLTNTLTFVSANPGLPACQETGGVIVCSLGNLAPGSSTQVIIVVTTPATAGPVPSNVDVKASEFDPNLVNNRKEHLVIIS